MTNHQWKPGDIVRYHDWWLIVADDGVPRMATGGFLDAPAIRESPGLRAIPIDVCEAAATELRAYGDLLNGAVGICALTQMADILDPPAPEPEPEWVTLEFPWGYSEIVNTGDVRKWEALHDLAAREGISAATEIADWALRKIDAQLADGKELRP